MDDKKGVETGGTAPTTEVVKKEDAGATTAQTVDLAETLEKTLEKLAKTETDRDNYKRGMLAAKGKTDEGEDDLETRLLNKLKAELLDTQATEEKKKSDDLTKKLIQRNKEMEEALKNKSQISTGMGSSTGTTMKVGDNMLSEDQLNALKAKDWDDKKIARFKENLLKVR